MESSKIETGRVVRGLSRPVLTVAGAVLLLLAGTGCGLVGDEGAPTRTRRDVIERINRARSQPRLCGTQSFSAAPALRWNAALASASLRHARDLAAHGRAGHVGSDGSRPDRRIAEAGYRAGAYGEIVAAGSASLDEVMAAWLASPGHCSVIMNPAFNEAGAAVAADRFWTVDFGAPE